MFLPKKGSKVIVDACVTALINNGATQRHEQGLKEEQAAWW